jgi:YD repeat-containing protein
MVSVSEYSDASTLYATTQYFYDAADRLRQVKDAQSNTTSIQYDWLGRKTGMDDPDMGVWTYAYDSRGNMASQIDARGEELTFAYDDLSRLIRKTDENTLTPDTTYTYGTDIGVIGLRTGMSDASGSASWTYSNFGRTVSEARTIGGETKTITTNADWLGRAIDTSYDDGEVISYHYDELGRPDQLQSDQTTLVDIAYNTLGQIATQTLGNSTLITNTYDFNAANNTGTTRLTSRKAEQDTTVLMELTYGYDSNGNITQLTDKGLGETHFYQYDSLNRLTSAVAGIGILTTPPPTPQLYGQKFDYDKVGNMLKMSEWGTPPTQMASQGQSGTGLAMQAPDVTTQEDEQSGQVYPVDYRAPAPQYQVPSATPTQVNDPFSVVMLHMNGADGSTTFIDDSNKIWTAAGDAQIDTAQSMFGGASAYFDGSGDYLSTPDSEDFNLGNEDFTIDHGCSGKTETILTSITQRTVCLIQHIEHELYGRHRPIHGLMLL